MQINRPDAGAVNGVDETVEAAFLVHVINANPAFHRDRKAGGPGHRADAFGHQCRLRHQAGAKPAGLHAVRRASNIQIDLGVAIVIGNAGGFGKPCGIAATKLQRHRHSSVDILGRLTQQPVPVAMDDGIGGDHFGEQQRVRRQMMVKMPAMPVRPIHHRRDAEPPVGLCHFAFTCHHGVVIAHRSCLCQRDRSSKIVSDKIERVAAVPILDLENIGIGIDLHLACQPCFHRVARGPAVTVRTGNNRAPYVASVEF